MNNFKVHAVDLSCPFGETRELELSDSGDKARYRVIIPSAGYNLIRIGKWQEVKYTKKGEPYIIYCFMELGSFRYKKRLMLKNFIRVGTPWLPAYKSIAN